MSEPPMLASMLAPTKNQLVNNPTHFVINNYIKHIDDTHVTIVKYQEHLMYQDQIEDPQNQGQMIDNPEAFLMPTIPKSLLFVQIFNCMNFVYTMSRFSTIRKASYTTRKVLTQSKQNFRSHSLHLKLHQDVYCWE